MTINLTISKSTKEITSGIPQYVTVEADDICNIYYTLDGTIPTTLSNVYIDKIYLNAENPTATLMLYATNGIDESDVIEQKFAHVRDENTRLPRAQTTTVPNSKTPQLKYPFGTTPNQPEGTFVISLDNGKTMFDGSVDGYSNGYNADGYANNFTNKPFTTENYDIVYSTRNAIGESGPGIGNLPADVIVQLKKDVPEESDAGDKLFDPRAFVIYVDTTKPGLEDVDFIQSQYMTLESPTVRDGAKLGQSNSSTANYIRSSYDARKGTMTSYYYDSAANRWLIVNAKYNKNQFVDNLSNYILGRNDGSQYVKTWQPYMRRYVG
jgi:hypothetical protein